MLVINDQEYISHHGVKGMKWGIRNIKRSINKAKKKHAEKKAENKAKKEKKIREEISGKKKASLRKKDDVQQNRYARNRIKTKGSKARAIGSEVGNLVGKTAKTLAIATGLTALAGLGLGGVLASAPVMSLASGAGGITTAIDAGASFLTGLAAGTVGVGLPSFTTAGAKTISNGSRFVKNVMSITAQKQDVDRRK